MQKNISEEVEEFLKPIVESLGYQIVEVTYKKEPNGMNLTIFIDSPSGINIEDCEKVHLAIDDPLDRLDPTNGASYTLNVSSPGLDRPIKTDSGLKANIGNKLEISLYSKINGVKNIVGNLVGFNDETLTVKVENKLLDLDRKNIAKIIKYIEF